MSCPIHLVIAGGHTLLRDSLAARLDVEPDIRVEAVAACAEEALQRIRDDDLSPDIVLLDIQMPGMVSFDAVERLRRIRPDARVVFLGASWCDHHIELALRLKAEGCLTKHESPQELIHVIRRVGKGETCFSPEVKARLVSCDGKPPHDGMRRTPLSSITRREMLVLQHIAEGRTRQEIAKGMGISAKTVAAHVSNIMRKLDIHDRVELARYAIREGLIQP